MIILNNLKKEVFDLLPLVRFVHDLEELLHLLLAKADLAFGWIISVDEPQKRARVLVVSVYLLKLSNLIQMNISGRAKKPRLGNIRLIDFTFLITVYLNNLINQTYILVSSLFHSSCDLLRQAAHILPK